jgi:hypothetical protein
MSVGKDKRIMLPVAIPAGYKWVACQPYGMWHAFKRRPRVHCAWEDREADGFVPKYWANQPDEIELTSAWGAGSECVNWRASLRRV